MRRLLLVFAVAGLSACNTLTPVDDPVYLRITDIEARLLRIERLLDNESLITLANDISGLREDLRLLVGDVETLTIQQDNQADRQLDLYVDIDDRLSQLESARQQMAQMPVSSAGGQLAPVNDQQAYDAAFANIQQQDWAAAQTAFQSFLDAYPSSSLRGNAQYWLGESFYAQLDFQTALREFERVLSDYPQSNKLPDALLKIGYSRQNLDDLNGARQALRRVQQEFPNTTAADLAAQRLRLID